MDAPKNNSPWFAGAVVTILLAIIGFFTTNPDSLCKILKMGCEENNCQLASTYYTDGNESDLVYVTKTSDTTFSFKVPVASYPWTATTECRGNTLTGDVTFEKNPETNVRFLGTINMDNRTIQMTFEFVGTNRRDAHILYPMG